MGWEVNADSFYRMIKRFWLYGSVKEIMITEGGAFYKDQLINGQVKDVERISYFNQYLHALLKAKQEGINISGYLAWTLMDNFEWSEGYNARFGLVHVDFKTQLRTIKNSGYWFRDLLKKWWLVFIKFDAFKSGSCEYILFANAQLNYTIPAYTGYAILLKKRVLIYFNFKNLFKTGTTWIRNFSILFISKRQGLKKAGKNIAEIASIELSGTVTDGIHYNKKER